jgi:hypothetical protein
MRNYLLTILTLTISQFYLLGQPWSSNGVCDFVDGTQWNNGGAMGCACSWYTVSGTDTILNCAYGDCGQSDLLECVYDCNGHNGNPTNSIPRQCDATATPICWFNGAGNAGQLFCQNLALPIELKDFWGVSTETSNEIYWTTVSEIDNDYFELSYSIDGTNYEVLTKMNGAGNSTQELDYRFIHLNAKRGIGYYILKQVDYNGQYQEYPPITINNVKINSSNLFTNVYPNPNESNMFYFNYNGNNINVPIMVRVTNNMGGTILEGVVNKFNNSQGIPFNLDGLCKGVYYVELTQNKNKETKKITVL